MNGKTGFINVKGELVIPPKFDPLTLDSEGDFTEGMTLLRVLAESPDDFSYKYGYIDETGRVAVEPRFEEASEFSEGPAVVRAGDGYGFIDKSGKYVWKPSE